MTGDLIKITMLKIWSIIFQIQIRLEPVEICVFYVKICVRKIQSNEVPHRFLRGAKIYLMDLGFYIH